MAGEKVKQTCTAMTQCDEVAGQNMRVIVIHHFGFGSVQHRSSENVFLAIVPKFCAVSEHVGSR